MPTPTDSSSAMLNMAKVTQGRLRHRPGFGRRAHRHRRRPSAAPARRRRIQPRHGGALEANARGRGRLRQGDVRQGGHLQDRLQQGDRDHHVSAADLNLQLRPTILDMKPGTRVVVARVHHGRVGARRDARPSRIRDAYLWIVPGQGERRVAACRRPRERASEIQRLDSPQKFQCLEGKARIGGRDGRHPRTASSPAATDSFAVVDGNGTRQTCRTAARRRGPNGRDDRFQGGAGVKWRRPDRRARRPESDDPARGTNSRLEQPYGYGSAPAAMTRGCGPASNAWNAATTIQFTLSHPAATTGASPTSGSHANSNGCPASHPLDVAAGFLSRSGVRRRRT